MSSILKEYNYDIFISYRQKDNKYDGWVTEFVDNLRKELEATFKEQVSVYFDINPSDYLLESYDVDASLKDKLKCLVFIPIISRTYCDSKSFAWVHEFRAFVEQASKDQFGLKIKLPNGNVAGRVLPVIIHDLDLSDIKECESVLGGVLRGIEFIYKEAGIDKPLSPDDDEKKNLNKTKYRIQIIKVAHAIKEIILGMKTEPIPEAKEKNQVKEISEEEKKIDLEKPAKAGRVRFLISTTVVALLIIAGIIAYPKIFKRDTLERLRASSERISIAVMPFQNMTNDTSLNIWQNGIQDILINSLSDLKTKGIIVRPKENVKNLLKGNRTGDLQSVRPSLFSKISNKLDADIIIYGSIKQLNSIIRLDAQMIDTKTNQINQSIQVVGHSKRITHLGDSLSNLIRDYLLLNQLKGRDRFIFNEIESTESPEAYFYYKSGYDAFYQSDFNTARESFIEALKCDSNFILALTWLALTDIHSGAARYNIYYEEAKEAYQKAYKNINNVSLRIKYKLDYIHHWYLKWGFWCRDDLLKLIQIDEQDPFIYYCLGNVYSSFWAYDRAIPHYEISLEKYKTWNLKPPVKVYVELGYAYHKLGHFIKEERLYKKAEKEYPDNPTVKEFPKNQNIVRSQLVLSLSQGDTTSINPYLDKYISIMKINSFLNVDIQWALAKIYSEAGILDKAEDHYRKAMSLRPNWSSLKPDFAYFLIDNDLNIDEGMELIDELINDSSDNPLVNDVKGWGLYKKGKYNEALKFLQKADSLHKFFNQITFGHLEAAKKAVAGQKSN